MVARPLELSAVATFLDSARTQASALLIEGDAGIGKTTLWLEAVQQARERGFRVLATRAGAAEVTLTFAALADLLSEVEEAVLDELPSMQRRAVDRVLSRTDEGPAIGEHVLGAAVLSVLKSLAVDAPVLVAIDDLQWLDASSRVVVAFAIRRLTGGVGVLGTVRTGTGTGAGTAHHDAGTWIQLSRPDGVHRIEVKPLALGGIHKLIVERLGRSLARPTLVKIAELSGGNPFYALELARASDLESSSSDVNLSPTLNSLVHSRIGLLDAEVRDALLAAAATAEPTVELLAHVCDVSTDRVVELLEDVENKGIVTITGGRLRFTHPLLATGVYTGASPSRRRTMHGKLATVVEQPELRARHLALAATSADSATVAALDAAADAAIARGAPLAAAELIDLAIALGADKPVRRIRAAELLFRAGA
ncbi:MAG: AAA family ATPase, partial [Mycobacterium sp.]